MDAHSEDVPDNTPDVVQVIDCVESSETSDCKASFENIHTTFRKEFNDMVRMSGSILPSDTVGVVWSYINSHGVLISWLFDRELLPGLCIELSLSFRSNNKYDDKINIRTFKGNMKHSLKTVILPGVHATMINTNNCCGPTACVQRYSTSRLIEACCQWCYDQIDQVTSLSEILYRKLVGDHEIYLEPKVLSNREKSIGRDLIRMKKSQGAIFYDKLCVISTEMVSDHPRLQHILRPAMYTYRIEWISKYLLQHPRNWDPPMGGARGRSDCDYIGAPSPIVFHHRDLAPTLLFAPTVDETRPMPEPVSIALSKPISMVLSKPIDHKHPLLSSSLNEMENAAWELHRMQSTEAGSDDGMDLGMDLSSQ